MKNKMKMSELEATRMKLKCLEMVEGTELKWFSIARMALTKGAIFSSSEVKYLECSSVSDIELAIGIIEGKPVWVGDTLYHSRWGTVVARASGTKGFLKIDDTNMSHRGAEYLTSSFSWTPPKPLSGIWPLIREYVQAEVRYQSSYDSGGPGSDMCKKASEQVTMTETAVREALENLK